MEEWIDDAHHQFNDEEAWRIAAIQTLAEKRIKDLNTKLIEANRDQEC